MTSLLLSVLPSTAGTDILTMHLQFYLKMKQTLFLSDCTTGIAVSDGISPPEVARFHFLIWKLLCQTNFLSFQTYRKAQNAYLYIPRTSCHPEGVFPKL